ncbi:MAG TPA: DUF4326 domain-containing protein [Polyangiaceae bacterium]
MAKPVRIQRSRARGARLKARNALPIVTVSRPSKWGNPFSASLASARNAAEKLRLRAESVAEFKRALIGRGPRVLPFTVADVRRELAGKNLACWCPLDGPCHADLLLQLANARAPRTR